MLDTSNFRLYIQIDIKALLAYLSPLSDNVNNNLLIFIICIFTWSGNKCFKYCASFFSLQIKKNRRKYPSRQKLLQYFILVVHEHDTIALSYLAEFMWKCHHVCEKLTFFFFFYLPTANTEHIFADMKLMDWSIEDIKISRLKTKSILHLIFVHCFLLFTVRF